VGSLDLRKALFQQSVPFLTGKNVRPGRLVLSDFDRVTNTFPFAREEIRNWHRETW